MLGIYIKFLPLIRYVLHEVVCFLSEVEIVSSVGPWSRRYVLGSKRLEAGFTP